MECPICLEADFTGCWVYGDSGFVTTRCGHVFHEQCVTAWWKPPNEYLCPTCKKNVTRVPCPQGPLQKLFIDSEEGPASMSPGPSTAGWSVRQRLDAKIRDLEKQLQNHIWRHDRVNEELNRIRDQHEELTVTHQAATQELETLHAQMDESRVAKEIAITEKLSQAESYEAQIAEMRMEYNTALQTVDARDKQVEVLTGKVKNLESERDCLQKTVAELTKDKVGFQVTIELLKLKQGEANSAEASKLESPSNLNLEELFEQNVEAFSRNSTSKTTDKGKEKVLLSSGDSEATNDSGKSSARDDLTPSDQGGPNGTQNQGLSGSEESYPIDFQGVAVSGLISPRSMEVAGSEESEQPEWHDFHSTFSSAARCSGFLGSPKAGSEEGDTDMEEEAEQEPTVKRHETNKKVKWIVTEKGVWLRYNQSLVVEEE